MYSFNIAQICLGPKDPDRTGLFVQQAIGENATFVCKRQCEESLYLANRWDISFDSMTYSSIQCSTPDTECTFQLMDEQELEQAVTADLYETTCKDGGLEFGITLKNLTEFLTETWLRCRVNGINSTDHRFVLVASFSFKLIVNKEGIRTLVEIEQIY